MASNYNYSYELQKLNQQTLLKDNDHLVSPDAVNKFRHLMLDPEQFESVHLHRLASSLIDNIIDKDIKPIIIFRQEEPQEPYNLPSKIELPDDQKLKLQLDIIEFAKTAVADANRHTLRTTQIRVLFKVRRKQRKRPRCDEEDTEPYCPICIDPLKEDDDNIKYTPCRHLFHEHCYYKWRRKSRSCPICRSKLPVT